jgi:hypothetical protein
MPNGFTKETGLYTSQYVFSPSSQNHPPYLSYIPTILIVFYSKLLIIKVCLDMPLPMDSVPHYSLTEVIAIGILAEVLLYGLISLYNGRKQLPSITPLSQSCNLASKECASERSYCLRDGVHLAFSGKVCLSFL